MNAKNYNFSCLISQIMHDLESEYFEKIEYSFQRTLEQRFVKLKMMLKGLPWCLGKGKFQANFLSRMALTP